MAVNTPRRRDGAVEVARPRIGPHQEQGISARLLRIFPVEPARPITLQGSWWVFGTVAAAVCGVLAVAIWMSAHLHPDPTLHDVALFVHLASFALGFGAVLVADYLVVLWLLRRSTFADAVYGAARLHLPIWIGLIGLALSGMLLQPNLAAWTTRAKLALVVVLTINGLQILMVLSKRMEASASALSMRLLTWGAVTTTVSQACWWGSMVIGFLTANKL